MVAIAVRDPSGTNYSPYSFPNPSLAQVGMSQPLNKPVLDHIDVIRGLVTRLQDAGRGRTTRASGRTTGSTNPNMANVPAGAKNTTRRGGAYLQQQQLEDVRRDEQFKVMIFRIRDVNSSQYLRLRGTQPAGVGAVRDRR